jgi:hypothetical protein
MNNDVVVTSELHGERTFRRVRVEPYQRRDGTIIELAIWEGSCVVCGADFEVGAPVKVNRPDGGSKSFTATTCPAHRLTGKEAMSLRFAAPVDRKAMWQEIKAAKLREPNCCQ